MLKPKWKALACKKVFFCIMLYWNIAHCASLTFNVLNYAILQTGWLDSRLYVYPWLPRSLCFQFSSLFMMWPWFSGHFSFTLPGNFSAQQPGMGKYTGRAEKHPGKYQTGRFIDTGILWKGDTESDYIPDPPHANCFILWYQKQL